MTTTTATSTPEEFVLKNLRVDDVITFFATKVKRLGNGAYIPCQRKFVGHEVTVMVKKKTPRKTKAN